MSTQDKATDAAGPDSTDVSTRRVDEADSAAEHVADRMPTDAEEAVADQQAAKQSGKVGQHFQEMAEIGAEVTGEGNIDGSAPQG